MGLAPSLSPSIPWNELAGWFLQAQQLLPELPEDGSQDPRGSAQRDRKPLLRVVQSKDTPSRSHRQRSAGPTALYQSYLHPPWMEPG